MGSMGLTGYVFPEPRLRQLAEQRGSFRPLTLTEPEAAYLAGIIDGEGTIGIYRVSRDPE